MVQVARSLKASVAARNSACGSPHGPDLVGSDQRTLNRFSNYYASVALVSILLAMAMGVLLILALISMGYDAVPSEETIRNPPQDWVWLWATIFLLAVGNIWLNLKAASGLQRRENRALCLAAAVASCGVGLNVLLPPAGLIAGLWTLRVLARDRVKTTFQPNFSSDFEYKPSLAGRV